MCHCINIVQQKTRKTKPRDKIYRNFPIQKSSLIRFHSRDSSVFAVILRHPMIDIVNCFIVTHNTQISLELCENQNSLWRWNYYYFARLSLFVRHWQNNWCDFNATKILIDKVWGIFYAFLCSMPHPLSKINPGWKENNAHWPSFSPQSFCFVNERSLLLFG